MFRKVFNRMSGAASAVKERVLQSRVGQATVGVVTASALAVGAAAWANEGTGANIIIDQPETAAASVDAGTLWNVQGDVHFAHDSYELDGAEQGIIVDIASQLDAPQFDDTAIVVLGETDPSGSAAYNDRLSVNRADTVTSALQDAGVDQQVRAYGAGERYAEAPDGQRNAADRTGAALTLGAACFADASLNTAANDILIIDNDSVAQAYLTVLAAAGIGVDPNGVDGKVGPGSRASAQAYAAHFGLNNSSISSVLSHIQSSLGDADFRAQLAAGLTEIRDNSAAGLDAVRAFDVTTIELEQKHDLHASAQLDCGGAPVAVGDTPPAVIPVPVIVPDEPGVEPDPVPVVTPEEGDTNWRFMSWFGIGSDDNGDIKPITEDSSASLMRDFDLEGGSVLSFGGFVGVDHPMQPSDLTPSQHNHILSYGDGFQLSPLSAGQVAGLGATYEFPSGDNGLTALSVTAGVPIGGARPELHNGYTNHVPDYVVRANASHTFALGEDTTLTGYVGAGYLAHSGIAYQNVDTDTVRVEVPYTYYVTETVITGTDTIRVGPQGDSSRDQCNTDPVPAGLDPLTGEFTFTCDVHTTEEVQVERDGVRYENVTVTNVEDVPKEDEYQLVAGADLVSAFNEGATIVRVGASYAAVWNQGGNPGLDGQGAEVHAGVTHDLDDNVTTLFGTASVAGMHYNDGSDTLVGRVEAGVNFDLDGRGTPYSGSGLHNPNLRVGVYAEEDFRSGRQDTGVFAGFTFEF